MDTKPQESQEMAPPQTDAKPTKPDGRKKPRSEAQQAATVKALAAMRAKRDQLDQEKREKKEVIKKAKKVVEDKILKDDVGFVMKNDFESLKKELYELKGLYAASQQQAKPEKPTPAPKQERIVERVIERVPERSTTPTRLTGHALLDKVFGF